jgi:hypothetical protein
MSISHRSNRLKLVGSPSVEKLQNGRYKLVVTCSTMNSREDWYSANKDRIFPDFGSLQSAEMSIDGLAPRTGEAYADMRLTQVESGNRSGMGQVGDYNVSLTYETLGSSFVQVKDDNTDYELNGLRRVTRTSIAEAGTDYAKTVGSSYIDHQIDAEAAVRCYLASYGIDDTDSFRQVQEVYIEAGTLSETLDNVGSQKAKVIETIGADPATPDGYSLASKQESDFEGFQTNRLTFLKNNVVLSESEDKVGSQLAIVKEVFNGTPTTPAGYLLANTQKSDVEGIPTSRYTFLKPSVLSESTDNVGSQKAKVIETFSETPVTPTGYSLANTQVSDFEGIKTNRYTFLKDNVELSRSEDKVGSQLAIITEVFNPTNDPVETDYSLAKTEESDVDGIPTKRFTLLKPSILSLQQDLVGGATTIQVSAFGMTESQVDADLSEVTASHILISQSEGDYEGIKTSQFTYEVDDFEVESQAEDGMEIIVRTELSATNFTSGVIGTSTYKTLFLAQENIDNGNTIKKRTSRYSEAGVLSISPLEEDGFSLAPSYVYVTTGAPASSMTGLVKPNGTALGTNVTWFEPKVQNVEGFSTYTQQVLSVALTTTTKVHSVNKFFTITEPGIMSTGGAYNSAAKSGAATRFPEATQQPRTYRKKATVDVYLTSSNLITETEVAFTELGVDWCSIGFDSFYTNELDSTASVSSNWRSFPQYLNSSGTTDTANASSLGVYFAEANSYGAGDTTYTTTGIYRVELEKYTRAVNGTQLYLKTIVTF